MKSGRHITGLKEEFGISVKRNGKFAGFIKGKDPNKLKQKAKSKGLDPEGIVFRCGYPRTGMHRPKGIYRYNKSEVRWKKANGF